MLFQAVKKLCLLLADGSTIILDSAAIGQLAVQGNMRIIKSSNGQLLYDHFTKNSDDNINSSSYNTMSTPRGGQYKLTLPDGTRVWLNAESSIKYPVVFESNKREVSVTGEVYFEVAKNPSKPFSVKNLC